MQYRVKTTFMAVRSDDRASLHRRFSFVSLRTGTVIAIRGLVQRSGLVDIECDGHILSAYMRDIEGRAELTEAA